MFTTGRVIFLFVFLILFVSGLIWSYRKEKEILQLHFKSAYKVLIALILFISAMFLIVKLKSFF